MSARSNDHLPEQGVDERIKRRRRRVAKAIGGVAVAPLILLGLDSAVTMALEPNIAPGVTLISSVEQCKDADAVYITMSSMGLPIAQYTANNVREVVEDHNGCVMATSYGTEYNETTEAILTDEMLEAVRAVTPQGSKPKKVIVHTQSFGIFAGRAALMSDAFRKAEAAGELKKAALIAESAPSGKESVKSPLARTMIDLSQDGLRIGKGTLWLFGLASAAERGDNLLDGKTWGDINTNTAATSTRLIGDQLDRIAKGLGEDSINVPIFCVGSENDRVVQIDVAMSELKATEKAEVVYKPINSLPRSYNHAGSWLIDEYKAAGYEAAITDILDVLLPARKLPSNVGQQRAA